MCYYISYPLYLVVDDYKIELNSNDFKSAVKFDYSINAYKTLTRIAAKYGSNYEEGVLKDTIIGKEDDVKRKRSHCSTAIHLMESIRILYKNLCKAPLAEFQLEMSKLFDNISSEKFLVQLLNEARVSNSAMSQIFNHLPEQMKIAFEKSFNASLIPYLDNLIFSVNKLNEQLVQASKGTSNILDDLFKSKDE